MNALYQWNAAAKAAEIGARIAAVSDPVASGLNSIPENVLSSRVAPGSPMPSFTVSCDGGAAACACAGGECDGMGSYSAEAMGLIVYGRAGKEACMTPASEYFAGMCNIFPPMAPQYVTIVYSQTGPWLCGTKRSGPFRRSRFRSTPPSSKTKLPFRFFFLPFASIDIPQVTTTITGEALSASAVN